jgi:uncharacterized protein YgiM (DUF1202 family)
MNRRRFLKTAAGGGLVIGIAPLTGLGRSAAAQNPYEHYIVNTDALNGRIGAGLSYEVVAVYHEGDVLEISPELIEYADGYTWRGVNLKPGPVWVAQEFLIPDDGGDPPADRVQVADGPLHVRSYPGLDSEVYFTAPTGAYGTVIDPDFVDADGYTWVYVQLDDNGVIGWMAMEFLSPIDVG